MRLEAILTLRIVAGVLRLRPTKRGTPSEITAPIATMSPFVKADKGSDCDPPRQASMIITSASHPGRIKPELSRKVRALFPVAAATAIAGSIPPKEQRWLMV